MRTKVSDLIVVLAIGSFYGMCVAFILHTHIK